MNKDVSADKSVFFTSDELTESVTSHVSLLGRDQFGDQFKKILFSSPGFVGAIPCDEKRTKMRKKQEAWR